MTTIGTVTITTPYAYSRRGYAIALSSCVDEEEFNQMRELFAKAEYGTAVHQIPGERPYGEDLTADEVNTVYVTWTHGTSGKVQNGYHLLRPSFSFTESGTPEGLNYVYNIRLFFLGTTSYYQACYAVIDLDTLDSDWEI
jgi:hypothetical protein